MLLTLSIEAISLYFSSLCRHLLTLLPRLFRIIQYSRVRHLSGYPALKPISISLRFDLVIEFALYCQIDYTLLFSNHDDPGDIMSMKNVYHLKPNIYIVRLDYTGVFIL